MPVHTASIERNRKRMRFSRILRNRHCGCWNRVKGMRQVDGPRQIEVRPRLNRSYVL